MDKYLVINVLIIVGILVLLAGIWRTRPSKTLRSPRLSDEEVTAIHLRGEGYGPEQVKLWLQLRGIGPRPQFLTGGLVKGPRLGPGEVPAILSLGLDLHLNPASQLPPVDCPLLISVQGQLLRASRPTFAERKGDDLEYELTGGGIITGRFPWTYQ